MARYSDADRAQLAQEAAAAVAAAGSQRQLAADLGVSPRMVRFALTGQKGFNLSGAFSTYTASAQQGQRTDQSAAQARAVADNNRRQTSTGRRAVRQPVQRVGPVSSLASNRRQTIGTAQLNTSQRHLVDAAAARGGRVSVRVEYIDSTGQPRTAYLYRKGGISAAVLQASFAQGATVATLLTKAGASNAPDASATVTGVTLTTF